MPLQRHQLQFTLISPDVLSWFRCNHRHCQQIITATTVTSTSLNIETLLNRHFYVMYEHQKKFVCHIKLSHAFAHKHVPQ